MILRPIFNLNQINMIRFFTKKNGFFTEKLNIKIIDPP